MAGAMAVAALTKETVAVILLFLMIKPVFPLMLLIRKVQVFLVRTMMSPILAPVGVLHLMEGDTSRHRLPEAKATNTA